MTEEAIIESARARFAKRNADRIGRGLKPYSNASGKTIYSGLCHGCGDVFFTFLPRQSVCGYSCLKGDKKTGAFKGGVVMENGYRKILVPGIGYEFEHRMAVELYLGRKLKPFENVHHKNGNRADNGLDNLELWAKPQPNGQRVKDLVDWVCDNYSKEIEAKVDIRRLIDSVIDRVAETGSNS